MVDTSVLLNLFGQRCKFIKMKRASAYIDCWHQCIFADDQVNAFVTDQPQVLGEFLNL